MKKIHFRRSDNRQSSDYFLVVVDNRRPCRSADLRLMCVVSLLVLRVIVSLIKRHERQVAKRDAAEAGNDESNEEKAQ